MDNKQGSVENVLERKKSRDRRKSKSSNTVIIRPQINQNNNQNCDAETVRRSPDASLQLTSSPNFSSPSTPRHSSRSPSNAEQNDISGDNIALGEMRGQNHMDPTAVPHHRGRSNGSREAPREFRTPVQSPTVHVKNCAELLMAPKKLHCARDYTVSESPLIQMLRSHRLLDDS